MLDLAPPSPWCGIRPAITHSPHQCGIRDPHPGAGSGPGLPVPSCHLVASKGTSAAPGQDWASSAWGKPSSRFGTGRNRCGVGGNREKHPLYTPSPTPGDISVSLTPASGLWRGGSGSPRCPALRGTFPHSKWVQVPQAGCENASPTPQHPWPHPAPGGSHPPPRDGTQSPAWGHEDGVTGLFPGAAGGGEVLVGAIPGGGGTNRRQRPGAKHAERPLISRSTVAPRGPGPQGSSGRAPTSCHRHRWRNRRGCAGRLERGGGGCVGLRWGLRAGRLAGRRHGGCCTAAPLPPPVC